MAVNPDTPSSPMAILKGSLTKLLQDQASTQLELATRQDQRQSLFEREVREALVRIETKRTQDLKTTRGGFDFEDAVISFMRCATHGVELALQRNLVLFERNNLSPSCPKLLMHTTDGTVIALDFNTSEPPLHQRHRTPGRAYLMRNFIHLVDIEDTLRAQPLPRV